MKVIGKFILFSMEEFADYLNDNEFSRKIKLIQNHHTYMPAYPQFKNNNHFKLLQAMENYHVNTNGWSEIGQNLTTFPDGTIALCRSIDKIPAGIKGANTNGICVEHVGNFDSGCDAMTPLHKACIIKTNKLLCAKFNLTPSTESIVYHHWYDMVTGKRTTGSGSTKSCPGTNFFGGNTLAQCEQNFRPLIKQ